MGAEERYWTLVKLDSLGRSRVDELSDARTFFQQHIGSSLGQDIDIQKRLHELAHRGATERDRILAELCLRCFISHQIEQACIQLENQFGEYYGFTRHDLFAIVLDDGGAISNQLLAISDQPLANNQQPKAHGQQLTANSQQLTANSQQLAANSQQLTANRYELTASKILEKFDPERANLAAWTNRLVKQHHELNAFLLEQGLCMLSDWAILNDTKPKKLQRVLTEFHQLTQSEVEQAVYLLESYHAVYRRDRLLKGQKGTCSDPTREQLQEISTLLQPHIALSLSPDTVLTHLTALASRLRQYRISIGGGQPPSQSLDQPDTPLLDQLSQESMNLEEDNPHLEFLQTYRQQFSHCLEGALQRVVTNRLQTLKPPKQQNFLTALQLFHCEQMTMGAIAKQIGLKAQYQVSRLLKLDELRSDVRHWMLQCLRQSIKSTVLDYVEPAKLDKIDHQIAIALEEQVDDLIQQEQALAKTPKDYVSNSLLAQKLCQYLDQRIAVS
ncbi:MAG: hypothetical protein NW220_09810 [Leptolyngbyaceae cyanobacterium bins.349]|nr:hypothetical protein [Leptolyngbyaceae cyanobacterium bins.349]